NRATFDLGFNRVGIDDPAAVHGAHHAMHAYLSVGGHRNFCYLRDKTADGLHGGDTAKASRRQRLAPFRFLGGDVQNISQTRSSTEKLAPEFIWVLAGSGGEFVGERFGNKAADRSSGRAPKADGNAGIVVDVFGAPVGDAVRETGNSSDGYGIDPL